MPHQEGASGGIHRFLFCLAQRGENFTKCLEKALAYSFHLHFHLSTPVVSNVRQSLALWRNAHSPIKTRMNIWKGPRDTLYSQLESEKNYSQSFCFFYKNKTNKFIPICLSQRRYHNLYLSHCGKPDKEQVQQIKTPNCFLNATYPSFYWLNACLITRKIKMAHDVSSGLAGRCSRLHYTEQPVPAPPA